MTKKTISYYGKLPSHGDFISQHMPRAFTEVWDSWLQENLVHWKNTLQGNWVADYLTMKPYRFILSSGIAGEVIWCGVLLPSRDQAGRLFPFTVCIPLSASETSVLNLFETHHDWLDKLEVLAIKCLMPDFDKEKLQGEFQKSLEELALQCPSYVEQSNSYTCTTETGSTQQSAFAWHSSALKGKDKASVNDLSSNLLNTVLKEYCHSYSIWWTRNDNDFMLCQGLPNTDLTPAFIDGQWNQWNWLTDNKSPRAKEAKAKTETPSNNNDDATISFKK